MKNRILTFLLFLSCTLVPGLSAWSVPVGQLTHFSTVDGLPQFTINTMLQDRMGYMWFGTWDGLSRFDGYEFRNFKVQPGDAYTMRSNRIEQLFEDKYGRIWIRSYDGEAHCFVPGTESFHGLKPVTGLKKSAFLIRDIRCMSSGKVWILSVEDGCVCVEDSLFHQTNYNLATGNLSGHTVNDVFEDKEGNSWLLTENGLTYVARNQQTARSFFMESGPDRISKAQSFNTAIEQGGEIWFGAGDGRIWKYRKADGRFSMLQLPATSAIRDIRRLDTGDLLIVTALDGFLLASPKGSDISHLALNGIPMPTSPILRTFMNRHRQLWFVTDKVGAYKLDLTTRVLRYFYVRTEDESTSAYPPKAIFIQDKNDRLWIQPRGGGFSYYDPIRDELQPFHNDPASGDWKFSNLAHSAVCDRQGNLWISTRSHGLEKAVFEKNYFDARTVNASQNAVVANDVRAVMEDKAGNLWVSTKDRRVNIYDSKRNLKGRFSMEGGIRPDALVPAGVYSIFQDKEGILWLGTKGGGLIRAIPAGAGWNVSLYRHDPADPYSLSDNKIYSIFQDSHRRIWVGTYDGGINLVQPAPDGKLRFIHPGNQLRNYPMDLAARVRFITEDGRGHLCIGTISSMVMFPVSFRKPEDISYHLFTRIAGNRESLSSNDVHGICKTRSGALYIVTFGGGLNKVTGYDAEGYPDRFQAYTSKNGLPSDITLSVVEDAVGMLWITTENNLTRFNPKTGVFETFAEIKRLMARHSFSEASSCRLRSGEIVFGFSGGMLSFNPNRIRNNTYTPYLALTNFQLFNKDVEVGYPSPLTENIDRMPRLTLSHRQNFFTIQYAALDFEEPGNIVYAYKLEGFDKDWQYAQQQRTANYTNIPHGRYVFRVRSTNSEGIWVDNERSLPVRVLPSFWQTWVADVLYVLLFFGLVLLCVYILMTIYRLRGDVRLERTLSEMKLRFFTDISHEIRTPLTLITAPVEYLMNDESTPEEIRKKLTIVSHHTARLQRLVNQILDFRKMQSKKLQVEEIDLGAVVSEFCADFSELAGEQHIDLRILNQAPGAKVWVDRDAFEKILMNLLSNAFKFTPAGKSVRVIVRRNDRNLDLSVQDDGPGIQKDKLKSLFNRFVSFNEDKNKPSTGIGLSMVKELAERHSAKVSVESDSGSGSCFTVSFLSGHEHFDKEVEIVYAPVEVKEDPIDTPSGILETKDVSPQVGKKDLPSVLIVEDDEELREFLCSILGKRYRILEAADGQAGYDKAVNEHPDFLISDVMMPVMDGIEMLRKLRENLETSHIPIVMLSAKSDLESRLEGMELGADDYITKPFSVPYFEARIANLLRQRKRLQTIYNSGLTSGMQGFDPKPFPITSQDERLMAAVVEAIEQNMDNSDFTVEDLGQAVGMSRSSFFNKVKGLTGLSPVEFIRDIRLKRAAQLLTSGGLLIKEVAYMTGFSDSRYFGECFKNKFGMPPAEYKKRQ